MEENVAGRGANGLSDANFVGALGDRNKHDVHDANATDDERDASNESEDAGDDAEKRAGGMSDFFAFENGEIGVAGFGGDEGFFDGVGGLLESVSVFGANVDLLDLK